MLGIIHLDDNSYHFLRVIKKIAAIDTTARTTPNKVGELIISKNRFLAAEKNPSA